MSIDLTELRAELDEGCYDLAYTRAIEVIEDSEVLRIVANSALDREAERMRENHDLEKQLREVRGELGVWKQEALRRRDEMRDAALSVHETIRLTVLDNGRVQVRLPSREVFLSTGQTMVVKSDGTYVTEWEA